MPIVSSKNLKGATELTVIAKIKPGLVETPDPISYTTRLERLLDVLFQQRKKSVEVGKSGFVGPLELLRGLHFVHWAIIDQGTRLLLTVAFDKPWEPYMRSIVDDAGPILDVIFFHCEGYERATTRHGHLAFAQWVRERQQTTNFFFADYPELSVDDIRFAEKLKSLHDSQQGLPAAFPLEARVDEPAPVKNEGQLLTTVLGLYRLKSYYPSSGDAQAVNGGDSAYTDLAIYNRAVRLIVQGFTPEPLEEFAVLPDPLRRAYNDIQAWYASVVPRPEPVLPPASLRPDDAEIQGNILDSYGRMSEGCAVLIKIKDASRLLSFLLARVTTQARAESDAVKCNVAFSYNGLKTIGLSAAELDAFSVEFRDGMDGRAGALGDVASNHPSRWRLPERYATDDLGRVALDTVDAFVTFQMAEASASDTQPQPLMDALEELAINGASILHVQSLHRDQQRWTSLGNYREHFGYVDGISQPATSPTPDLSANRYNNDVTLGEVLVGYPNDHADTPSAFSQSALMKNGSFLVVRKLAQDVETFERFVTHSAAELGKHPSDVKGLLMGRSPDGVPLASGAKPGSDLNAFDYAADQAGRGCPFQAHVRLANPRTPTALSVHGRPKRIPRIVRRGFSYGLPYSADAAPAERGLLFMAYNANIAEQYEVVQRWLNAGNSTGLPTSQNDPISGVADAARDAAAGSGFVHQAPFRFKDAGGDVLSLDGRQPSFVKLEWGMYLFAPSIKGLGRLLAVSAHPAGPLDALLPAGGAILQALINADSPLAWKKILEGQGERDKALALWAAIRERGGVLKTSYGVLVGSQAYALEVLKDESRFSAREYWLRMKASSIPMHLGMDKTPVPKAVCPMRGGVAPDLEYVADIANGTINYAAESLANPELYSIHRYDAFKAAYGFTVDVLDKSADSTDTPNRKLADLFIVGEQVVAQLSQLWFGLPDGELMKLGGQPLGADDDKAYCPADFTYAAQYIFRPNPDPWTIALATQRGRVVQATAQTVVKKQLASGAPHRFIAKLIARSESYRSEHRGELVVRSLVGAVDGFVAATWGSFVTTIGQWVKTEELWQVQLACEDDILTLASAARAGEEEGEGKDEGVDVSNRCSLVQRLFKALMIAPVPAWLHRTALQRTTLGGVPIEPGDRIAINLGSAALDKGNPLMLFGGEYSEDNKGAGPTETPQHACPAQEAAIGALLGMMVAVLERKSLRAEGAVVLSFDA